MGLFLFHPLDLSPASQLLQQLPGAAPSGSKTFPASTASPHLDQRDLGAVSQSLEKARQRFLENTPVTCGKD